MKPLANTADRCANFGTVHLTANISEFHQLVWLTRFECRDLGECLSKTLLFEELPAFNLLVLQQKRISEHLKRAQTSGGPLVNLVNSRQGAPTAGCAGQVLSVSKDGTPSSPDNLLQGSITLAIKGFFLFFL